MLEDWDQLLDAVALVESNNKSHAVNPKSGALGMYQFMPDTYKEVAGQLGIQPEAQDPFNPAQARAVARSYLNTLWLMFGKKIDLMLAAYNWGLGNVLRKVRETGVYDWEQIKFSSPMETQLYVKKVLEAYNRRQDVGPA